MSKKYGVYCITNLKNGKMYIGMTLNSFRIRKNLHFSKLHTNKHSNRLLQEEYNEYGKDYNGPLVKTTF